MVPGLTSIVIPTYDHDHCLHAAIESALAQTAPIEVIVVDDGSQDDTPDVLDEFGAPIRWFRKDHRGPSRARNRGITESHGEFVMFLDADDGLAPTKVGQQLHAFTPDVGWVICD